MQLALSDDYDRADELLSDDDGGRASSASSPPRTSESVPPDVLRNSKILQVCSPPGIHFLPHFFWRHSGIYSATKRRYL